MAGRPRPRLARRHFFVCFLFVFCSAFRFLFGCLVVSCLLPGARRLLLGWSDQANCPNWVTLQVACEASRILLFLLSLLRPLLPWSSALFLCLAPTWRYPLLVSHGVTRSWSHLGYLLLAPVYGSPPRPARRSLSAATMGPIRLASEPLSITASPARTASRTSGASSSAVAA